MGLSGVRPASTFAHMFDELVTAAGRTSGGEAIGAWAKVEAAACARRLAAMVEVLDRCHAADGSAEREQWYLDNWGAVSAEVGAAQQITSAAASNQLLIASALRDRLPSVAARFADGALSYRTVTAIVYRTAVIKDPAALRAVDAKLAKAVERWEPMSVDKFEKAIDYWVDRYDSHALRKSQRGARSRCLEVGTADASGMTSLWGTLFAHDAKAFDRWIVDLANTVCRDDGRTRDQRRADAMGAMADGLDRLACRCGADACPAVVAPPNNVIIHVVAKADDITDDDAELDGAEPRVRPNKPIGQMTLAEALREPPPTGPSSRRAGVMMGGSLVPPGLLGRLACQAQIRTIVHPGDAPPEPRYRPSQALADFVRCRDLTCRFPGCDQPADVSDIDHTIAYPVGPTQASNLKCLCRKHHLLKTFWSGALGWRDKQHPDGTVVWTSPSGQSFTTRPGSHLQFPSLCRPTAAAVAKPNATTLVNTGLAMPRRGATRARDRLHRINAERLLNEVQPRTDVLTGPTMPRRTIPEYRPSAADRPSRLLSVRRRPPTTEITTCRWTTQLTASSDASTQSDRQDSGGSSSN